MIAMLRSLVHFVLFLTLFAACTPGKPVEFVPRKLIVDHAINSTVSIHDLKGHLLCAGTRISPTLIVTAFHCVIAGVLTDKELDYLDQLEMEKQKPSFQLVDSDTLLNRIIAYGEYKDMISNDPDDLLISMRFGVVYKIDGQHDVAVIQTERSSQPYVKIRTAQLELAEPVFAVGHPKGFAYSATFGYVSVVERRLYGSWWIHANIGILGGNSGGGLYDELGNLVGVCSMGMPSHGFFSGSEHIIQLLQ